MIEVDPDYEPVEIAEFSDEFEYRHVNGNGTAFVFDSSIQLKEDDEIFSLIADPLFMERNSSENFNNSIARMRLIVPDLNYNLANATIGIRSDDLFYFSIWDKEEDYDRIRVANMNPELQNLNYSGAYKSEYAKLIPDLK